MDSNQIHNKTNALAKATSLYLRQHRFNPVLWVEYTDAIVEKAHKEQKLLLFSIGYAACHWCHVMERECFEDQDVAAVMNRHFICVKIDREERPDLDQLYMDALQLMTGSGGWPLNIVALPDGRPFWGATYLPKERWMAALKDLQQLYMKDKERVLEYATSLSRGLKAMAETPSADALSEPWLKDEFETLIQQFLAAVDTEFGGFKGAPKFMMPNTLEFALHYHLLSPNQPLFTHVQKSLDSMSYGALFDPINGGFSRYSVDSRWHVVHFEKMAYDNAQLLSVYAKTFAVTKNKWYQNVALKTIDFLEHWLYDPLSKGFFASIDADSSDELSEQVEGAYYRFTLEQLKEVLGDHYELFAEVYNFNELGHWEHGQYLLHRTHTDEQIAGVLGISVESLENAIIQGLSKLKKFQQQRKKPACDDKIISSWNALIVSALAHICRYLDLTENEKNKYVQLCLGAAQMLTERIEPEGRLLRIKNPNTNNIDGFLEDYALCMQCFIDLYELTFEPKFLDQASTLYRYVLAHFDAPNGFFYFTADLQKQVVRRSLELEDNVISSSNALMAKNLFRLGALLSEPHYSKRASALLQAMKPQLIRHPRSYSAWLQLALFDQFEFYEIAVIGTDFDQKASAIGSHYLPNSVLAAAKEPTEKGLLNKASDLSETAIFACVKGSCSFPVLETEQLLNQLQP
jgi:uncharacterized protein YyaL (SSP411 family)